MISFLKPIAVSTVACSTAHNLDGAEFSQLAAEDGGILANGERQLSISR